MVSSQRHRRNANTSAQIIFTEAKHIIHTIVQYDKLNPLNDAASGIVLRQDKSVLQITFYLCHNFLIFWNNVALHGERQNERGISCSNASKPNNDAAFKFWVVPEQEQITRTYLCIPYFGIRLKLWIVQCSYSPTVVITPKNKEYQSLKLASP